MDHQKHNKEKIYTLLIQLNRKHVDRAFTTNFSASRGTLQHFKSAKHYFRQFTTK